MCSDLNTVFPGKNVFRGYNGGKNSTKLAVEGRQGVEGKGWFAAGGRMEQAMLGYQWQRKEGKGKT